MRSVMLCFIFLCSVSFINDINIVGTSLMKMKMTCFIKLFIATLAPRVFFFLQQLDMSWDPKYVRLYIDYSKVSVLLLCPQSLI